MNKQLDVLSNVIFITCFRSGLDLPSPIKGFVCTIFLPSVFFNSPAIGRLLEASQHQVKAERLCSGCAGPDSLGTGSVSGFGDWRLVAKSYPQGALTEQLDSYWNRATVCVSVCASVSGIRICVAPGGLPDGLDGEPKQAEDSYGLEK